MKTNRQDSSILYIDCFSGISGDMFIGAALDLNAEALDAEILLRELSKIDLDGYEVSISKVKRGSVYGTLFDVKTNKKHPQRDFRDIKALVNNSSLKKGVKDLALRIFSEIARAESIIHSKSHDSVHFHEVGAVDSIIDIVSASIVVDLLNIEKVYGSMVPLGRGTAKTMHGLIPVPAPATIEILKGVPVYGGGFDFEVTTPTGASIMKVLVEKYGGFPDIIIENTGLGAGSRVSSGRASLPNVLRLVLGKPLHSLRTGVISSGRIEQMPEENPGALLISTNIDDSTPEITGYVLEKILEEGALDTWVEPIYMKKNRPSFKLCTLCSREKMDGVLETIFKETSTLGVRIQEITRFTLRRKMEKVKLPYGEVDIKIGLFDGREVTFSPEYRSCLKLAKNSGRTLKEIYRDALFFLSKR